jgi:hypothetical protein
VSADVLGAVGCAAATVAVANAVTAVTGGEAAMLDCLGMRLFEDDCRLAVMEGGGGGRGLPVRLSGVRVGAAVTVALCACRTSS